MKLRGRRSCFFAAAGLCVLGVILSLIWEHRLRHEWTVIAHSAFSVRVNYAYPLEKSDIDFLTKNDLLSSRLTSDQIHHLDDSLLPSLGSKSYDITNEINHAAFARAFANMSPVRSIPFFTGTVGRTSGAPLTVKLLSGVGELSCEVRSHSLRIGGRTYELSDPQLRLYGPIQAAARKVARAELYRAGRMRTQLNN